MITDPSTAPGLLPPRRSLRCSLTHTLWLAWGLALGYAAVWAAWSALGAMGPHDVTRLVMHSALVVVTGLLLLTAIELRLAPWRFLDVRSWRVPHQGKERE